MERENGIRTDGMAGGLARRLLERSMPESTNEDDGTMPDLDSLIARNRELQQRLEAVGEERTRLSSGNQRLRRQLSALNETSRKLNEANRRERECAAREERCRRIERREAELADGEARLRRDRSRLDAERDGMEDEIGRRVAERCGLERARLEREAADRLGFGRRLLFVLVTGTCVFASIMLFAVMAGQWRALLASLPEWVRGRSEQVGSVVRWVSAMLMEFGRASQSWWYRPLLLMAGILVLALAAAMGVLVYSAGRTAMDAWREYRAWNTLPVHMVFWTFLASGTLVVSVEVGRMVGGRVHWLTLWIVLAVSAFIAYHRILSRRVDDFIRDNR